MIANSSADMNTANTYPFRANERAMHPRKIYSSATAGSRATSMSVATSSPGVDGMIDVAAEISYPISATSLINPSASG